MKLPIYRRRRGLEQNKFLSIQIIQLLAFSDWHSAVLPFDIDNLKIRHVICFHDCRFIKTITKVRTPYSIEKTGFTECLLLTRCARTGENLSPQLRPLSAPVSASRPDPIPPESRYKMTDTKSHPLPGMASDLFTWSVTVFLLVS